MKKQLLALVLALGMAGVFAAESENPLSKLDWHMGPASEKVGQQATLKTADGLMFLDDANSKQFLQLTGNIPESGNNILYSRKDSWWAAFSFNPSGYVKDDEKIDADELLRNLKSGDESSNEERKRLGISALTTEGWYVPPHYDTQSKTLEWGLKLNSEGRTVLNYTVRLLGRSGVMSATLVSDPEHLDADVKAFKAALTGFAFNSGEKYSEFRDGDKMAAYGLGALIVGGAAAVATKKGFWAVLGGFLVSAWKVIAVAFVGVGAWLRSLFQKKS